MGLAPGPITLLDRIRTAVAALPIGAAVLDGEAVTFDREGQGENERRTGQRDPDCL